MPILDGYRATHLLRQHSPYTSLPGLRQTPIVAMTASAIQGDRERCERAGMDDYLAKPVRSHVLEGMLIKWALRRRESEADAASFSWYRTHTDTDTNCADMHSYSTNLPTVTRNRSTNTTSSSQPSRHHTNLSSPVTPASTAASTTPGAASPATAPPAPPPTATAPTYPHHASSTSSSNLHPNRPPQAHSHTNSATPNPQGPRSLPLPESEGERSLRRVAAEEKALELRNDKLLSAADEEPHASHQGATLLHSQLSPSAELPPGPMGEALTEENIGKLGIQGYRNHSGGGSRLRDSMTTTTTTDEDGDTGGGDYSNSNSNSNSNNEDEADADLDGGGGAADAGVSGPGMVGSAGPKGAKRKAKRTMRGLWAGVPLGTSSKLTAESGGGHSRNTSLHAHRGSIGEADAADADEEFRPSTAASDFLPVLNPNLLGGGRAPSRSPLASPPLVAQSTPFLAGEEFSLAGSSGGGKGLVVDGGPNGKGQGDGEGGGGGVLKRPHLTTADRKSSERTVRPGDP